MGNLPLDLREFIGLLNSHNVRYLVVGGYAVAYHGYPRLTGDIDFFVEASFDPLKRFHHKGTKRTKFHQGEATRKDNKESRTVRSGQRGRCAPGGLLLRIENHRVQLAILHLVIP